MDVSWSDIERLARDTCLEVDVLRAVALPAVALTPASATDGPAATGSYFGGLPMLPLGTPWPAWSPHRYCRAERKTARRYIAEQPSTSPHWTAKIARLDELEARGAIPLMFLAQFDLDQLARVAPITPLPSTGKLLVFAEFQFGAASLGRADPVPPWRLLWFPNDLARTRAEPPTTADGFVLQQHSMTPSPVPTFPDTVMRDGVEVYSRRGADDYDAFLSALETMGVRGRNQVGGHPLQLQGGDIPTMVSCRHDGYDSWNPPPDGVSDRLAARAARWRFLLQIAEDYRSQPSWSGVASFWGAPRAIAAGNFSEAELHFEDT